MTQTCNLTVIQINDTHGYLEPHPELVWSGSNASYRTLGGYARIASLLNTARRENPGGVLVLGNGDAFHGTYPAVNSRGEALIPLVNALKIDAMTRIGSLPGAPRTSASWWIGLTIRCSPSTATTRRLVI